MSIIVKNSSIRAFRFLFVKVKDFEEANRELLKDQQETTATSEQAIPENETGEEKVSPAIQTSPEQTKIVESNEPVIRISASEPPKKVRHTISHEGAIPTPKSTDNADKSSALASKPLKIRIDKPQESIRIEQVPIGLQHNLHDDNVEVGTRFSRHTIDKTIPLSNETLQNELSQENVSIDETEQNVPEAIQNQNNEQIDSDSVQANIGGQISSKAGINTDYFKVEEKEEEIIIDDALIIEKKPIRIDLPAQKPILPPEPIRVQAPIQASAGKAPLVVHLEELEPEELPLLNTPLGVSIHDQEISYEAPKISLLDIRTEEMKVSDEELKNNAKVLQEKLETFNIFIEDLTVTPGPVVTQYEFVPAAGIKISRIEGLSDDLAMALKAKGIRIIAPIPGKGTVGIEIPNLNPSMVRFSHVVNTTKFYESQAKLPLALGKTISGEVLITDLAKAPHLMIAGSTGSGKSVGINTIINSLLYRMKPSDLKFVIVDPKKVELQQYARLRHHFLALSPDIEDSIITNPQDAVSVLKSVVIEMENRYDILARVGQRNIADYNDKVKAGTYKSIKDFDHRPMPYIVVVIDELADLMLTASKEVEEPIIRLAQMARAVGIHLIVATQRPSVNVITGIIKANFPARIAYLVASKIDSRTILDISGAEQLLGNGDMLFLPGGSPKPIRIQNAFISTDEVENICNFIGKQDGYSKPYLLPSILEEKTGGGNISASERDPLFEDAARLVIQHGQASVSLVQRRLKVGYARAGRIIDELEDAGVVGPNEGSKSRMVLYESESDLERIL